MMTRIAALVIRRNTRLVNTVELIRKELVGVTVEEYTRLIFA